MAERKVESEFPRVTHAPQVIIQSIANGRFGEDIGKLFTRYEYKAMLNQGEIVRVRLMDPYYTMLNQFVGGPYYENARAQAPTSVVSKIRWAGSDSGDLETELTEHALMSIAPFGPDSNEAQIEFLACDYASFYLEGGDAGGYHYKGNVQKTIEQVVDKYSRGDLQADIRAKLNDNTENSWWQCRMPPKAFIMSLLEWSTSINEQKTRWCVYPDGGPSGQGTKLIIQEQGKVPPLTRSTYKWKGYGKGSEAGHGDIRQWTMMGDNALQLVNHKIVTSGISCVSGAYWDRIIDQPQEKVFVGDKQSPGKYKPKTSAENAFTRPKPMADPLSDCVGWTSIPAIPEFSAGDLGIKYEDYMDGYGRAHYLRSEPMLMRVCFEVNGHHIWCQSEGLGADVINIEWLTDKGERHFLHGRWIVYGYHHIVTRVAWITKLYCYRIDFDADAQAI